MDLWVAAVAAKVGHLTRHRQSSANDSEEGLRACKKFESVDTMDRNIEQRRLESGGNLFRRLIRRQVAEGAVSKGEKILPNSPGRSLNASQADGSLEAVAGSCRMNENGLVGPREYLRDDSSLLSLQPWIFKKEPCQYAGEEMNENGDFSDSFSYDSSETDFSPRSVSLGYGHGTNRRSLRSRRSRRFPVKPLNSIDNCLIPPLYSEQFEIDDHVFSSFPPPTKPCIRPFLITDGEKIISKSTFDPLGMPSENGVQKEVDAVSSGAMRDLVGVPVISSVKYKRKSREPEPEVSALHSQRSNNLPQLQGSPARMLLFSLGIAIGVMFNVLSNRKEVKKLNDLLKQTENLVQDLQEELEMKTSFTVKELDNEVCRSQEHNDSDTNGKESLELLQNQLSDSIIHVQKADEDVRLPISKAIHKSASMSKIEAELEAELEKLDLNMTTKSLYELDPDLIAEVVHGELRDDTFHHGARDGQADSQSEHSSTSTTDMQDGNYAVSPRELSFRLHEVVQSRLEVRIKELERALHQSQKQLESMKSEQAMSQRAFSSSDMGSSSNQESPKIMGRDQNISDLPLCLKLTGDALNAYDEAYEEFTKLADFDEKNLSSSNICDQKHEHSLCPANRSLIWGMEAGVTNKLSSVISHEREQKWEETFRGEANNTDGNGGVDEFEYDSDDEEKRFIQQILERTRQGSPALTLAQKMLFSLDN